MKKNILAIAIELIPILALLIALINLFGAECEIYIVWVCAVITFLGFAFALIGKKISDTTITKILRIFDYLCVLFAPIVFIFTDCPI